MQEDKRLERLFDYTKWHIGIYLSIGGAIVTLLASDKSASVLAFLTGSKVLLGISLFLMVVAGFAGGVIASSITLCKTFEEFWDFPQGPVEWKPLKGRYWPKVEHIAFWASLFFLGLGVLVHPSQNPIKTCDAAQVATMAPAVGGASAAKAAPACGSRP